MPRQIGHKDKRESESLSPSRSPSRAKTGSPTLASETTNKSPQQTKHETPIDLIEKVTDRPQKTSSLEAPTKLALHHPIQSTEKNKASNQNASITRYPLNFNGITLPQFSAPRVIPVSKSPEQIVAELKPKLHSFINNYNYDRICYLGNLYDYCSTKGYIDNPESAPKNIFDEFSAESHMQTNKEKGGHCAALAVKFQELLPKEFREASYLAAGEIKDILSIRNGPRFNHGVLLIKYTDPNKSEEPGFIVADPSFDFVHLPIVSETRTYNFPYSMSSSPEEWHFSFDASTKTIICQPRPNNAGSDWIPSESSLKKRTTYRTDELINPDASITHPIMAKDSRPVIVSRTANDKTNGIIAISYSRKIVTIRMGKAQEEINFSTILAQPVTAQSWATSFEDPLEATFQVKADILSQKVAKAVHLSHILDKVCPSVSIPTV